MKLCVIFMVIVLNSYATLHMISTHLLWSVRLTPSVVLSQVAVAGGFALKTLDNGTVVMRNPSTVHLIPMLDSVLALARCVALRSGQCFSSSQMGGHFSG